MTGFPQCSHGDRGEKRPKPRETFRLICEEPFRLFFPAGLVVSVCGVSLWPLLYMGVLSFPPHVPHARVMIEGFFGAFIIGFMGTAMPRMLTAPRLTGAEIISLFVLYLGVAFSHLTGRVALGDGFFLFLFAGFVSALGARFLFLRKDLPPPGFVLAAMGLLGAIAAAALFVAENVVTLSPLQQGLAKLLLYQGFALMPILGVGVFLLPRFLGGEKKARKASWNARATLAAGCGVLIFVSFWIEASGHIAEGRILRAVVAAAYFLNSVPLFRRSGEGGTLAFSLRVAAVMIPVGLLATAIFPQFQKGYDHLFLVSGFGLLVLTVASRVLLGHADRIDLAQGKSRRMQWVIWIVLIGALTRASADPLPHIAVSHHLYAALLWIVAAVIWASWVFPKLRGK